MYSKRCEVSYDSDCQKFYRNEDPISDSEAIRLWHEVGAHDWTFGAYKEMCTRELYEG